MTSYGAVCEALGDATRREIRAWLDAYWTDALDAMTEFVDRQR